MVKFQINIGVYQDKSLGFTYTFSKDYTRST